MSQIESADEKRLILVKIKPGPGGLSGLEFTHSELVPADFDTAEGRSLSTDAVLAAEFHPFILLGTEISNLVTKSLVFKEADSNQVPFETFYSTLSSEDKAKLDELIDTHEDEYYKMLNDSRQNDDSDWSQVLKNLSNEECRQFRKAGNMAKIFKV